MGDSQSSSDLFQDIAQLAKTAKKSRTAIYVFRFDFMAFGSWEIVAGRRRRMIRFTYDGKESYLSYGDASVEPKSHKQFAALEGDNPIEFVGAVLTKEFAD